MLLGAALIVLALMVIAVFLCAVLSGSTPDNNDNPVETIQYNQNGYHSSRSGYQTGKYSKNNAYNGR